MRVLVCGGRDYTDGDHVHNELTRLNHERGPFTCVIHGAARGVDYEAMIWAQMMASVQDIKHAPFAAEWNKYGNSAGPIRNKRMLDEGKPDLIIAFSGGKGTNNMIHQAEMAKIEIIKIEPRKTP